MRKRFKEEQIIQVLKEHEAGAKTAELCRLKNLLRNSSPSQCPHPLKWPNLAGLCPHEQA